MTGNTIERILEICKEKNIPISRVEKDLGFGNGSLNPEKASDVKSSRLFKILNYLDVSFEEFYGIPPAPIYKKEEPVTNEDDGNDEISKYVLDVMKSLPIEGKIRLANKAQSLKEELQAADNQKGSV